MQAKPLFFATAIFIALLLLNIPIPAYAESIANVQNAISDTQNKFQRDVTQPNMPVEMDHPNAKKKQPLIRVEQGKPRTKKPQRLNQ